MWRFFRRLWSQTACTQSRQLSGSRRRPRRAPTLRRWSSFGRLGGGERLEFRVVPSAAPVVASPVAITGDEGFALQNVPVATFTAGDGSQAPSSFNAVINWGDGATTAGSVTETNNTYTVTGTHTYLDQRTYPVVVGIQGGAAPTFVVDQASIAPILPDGTVGTVDQRFIHEYLLTTLQRPVDMQTINYWVGQFEKNHGDRQTLSLIFLESTPPYEYRRGEIDSSYETYLHRAADQGGENYFLNQVNLQQGVRSGPGLERRTSALLINSDEYFNQRAGGTLQGFVTAVYEDALKRPPSANDLAYWEFALTHGVSHIEFATTVLNSHEFLVRSINSLYERYLGRPADPTGLQNFLFNFAEGYGTESNTETLLDTPEFYSRATGVPIADVPPTQG